MCSRKSILGKNRFDAKIISLFYRPVLHAFSITTNMRFSYTCQGGNPFL